MCKQPRLVHQILHSQAPPNANYSTKIPGDTCWPSETKWAALNRTVSGRLLQTTPVAAPCYAGSGYNAAECASVVANWTQSSFQADYPIGYIYPEYQSCDIPGGNTTTCSLGNSPVYAINASTPIDIVAGVQFAEVNNIRLVVKTTGHDILARYDPSTQFWVQRQRLTIIVSRSRGTGSLEIWLRYFRHGVKFQERYEPSNGFCNRVWDGPAISVRGGYSWEDAYSVAMENNVVVVGGGCPVSSADSLSQNWRLHPCLCVGRLTRYRMLVSLAVTSKVEVTLQQTTHTGWVQISF